jgi:hypothetical protein
MNPSSFVVIAPTTAKEGSGGGAFTSAATAVLEAASKDSLDLTVSGFAGHIQARM